MNDVGRYVYVAQYGDTVKVGVTVDLLPRLSWYRWRSRKDNVAFTPLLVLPRHLNAGENEHATIRRFLPAGQRWTEYLTADAREVVAFARELPRIDVQRYHWDIDRTLVRLAARTGVEVAS